MYEVAVRLCAVRIKVTEHFLLIWVNKLAFLVFKAMAIFAMSALIH
jgi:hypothetical protein